MTSSSPETPDPSVISAGLVSLLDLREITVDESLASPTTVRAFEGDSSPQPGGHVFGGQVMGQAVAAAGRSTPEGRRIHSMYSYFLAPGDPAQRIRFHVDALRDGGSFSVRRVLATQPHPDGERTILAMTASFQEQQEGLDHQEQAPEAPDPEGLPTTAEVLAGSDHPVARYGATQRPIDIPTVTDPNYMRPARDGAGADTQMGTLC